MKTGIMRQVASVCVIAVFLTGCGTNLSDQIEGETWVSKSGRLTRYVNGTYEVCMPKVGNWKALGTYEIDGNTITFTDRGKTKTKEISITGDGLNKIFKKRGYVDLSIAGNVGSCKNK